MLLGFSLLLLLLLQVLRSSGYGRVIDMTGHERRDQTYFEGTGGCGLFWGGFGGRMHHWLCAALIEAVATAAAGGTHVRVPSSCVIVGCLTASACLWCCCGVCLQACWCWTA